ncbi:unnamed protein product, partial [Gadus morhua 'NCC']
GFGEAQYGGQPDLPHPRRRQGPGRGLPPPARRRLPRQRVAHLPVGAGLRLHLPGHHLGQV